MLDRDDDIADVEPEIRADMVRRTANHLLEHHECNHNRWRYVSGASRCEECHQYLPLFILQCRQCFLRACQRCRCNRF